MKPWRVTLKTRCGCTRDMEFADLADTIVVPLKTMVPAMRGLEDGARYRQMERDGEILMEKREFRLRSYDHVGRTAVYDEVEPLERGPYR